jgi:hypothetical protein
MSGSHHQQDLVMTTIHLAPLLLQRMKRTGSLKQLTMSGKHLKCHRTLYMKLLLRLQFQFLALRARQWKKERIMHHRMATLKFRLREMSGSNQQQDLVMTTIRLAPLLLRRMKMTGSLKYQLRRPNRRDRKLMDLNRSKTQHLAEIGDHQKHQIRFQSRAVQARQLPLNRLHQGLMEITWKLKIAHQPSQAVCGRRRHRDQGKTKGVARRRVQASRRFQKWQNK